MKFHIMQCQHGIPTCLHSSDGVNQSIPIVLPLSTSDKERLKQTGLTRFRLTYNGRTVAILKDVEFFAHRKEERCARTFGAVNPGHPAVKVSLGNQMKIKGINEMKIKGINELRAFGTQNYGLEF